MSATRNQVVAARRAADVTRSLAEDLRRLREDAGVSQRALARAAGVDQSLVSRLEAGLIRPSLDTCSSLAAALGVDVSLRLFPNSGPAIRDRHQARIVEGLAAIAGRNWECSPEVGVRQPVRGWIDLLLIERNAGLVVAIEVQSEIIRLEQLLRWAGAKADALPSARSWPFGIGAEVSPGISRALVVRSTAGNRAVAVSFDATLRAAYPGDPWQALASLKGRAVWPGPAVLWATTANDGRTVIQPEAVRGGHRGAAASSKPR
jgi:transcriptional regulator with XRE-family HTH domain